MKKRILIGYLSGVGGIDKYITNVVNALEKNDVQIDILTSVDLKDSELAKKNNVNLLQIDRLTHPFKRYAQTKQILRNNHYDIIYFNISEAFNCVCNLAAKKYSKATIIAHSHSSSNDSSNSIRRVIDYTMHKIFIPILKKKTDYYFACSTLAGKWLFGDNIVTNKKFRVIHNTVDVNKFTFIPETRNVIRTRYSLKDDIVLIGFVGNFVYQKNIFMVLEIFKQYHQLNPNSCLLMLGDGELKNELLGQIQASGLDSEVILPGLVNNVQDYMSAFDVFILPSRFEGMPIVGIEAQVNGLVSLFADNIAKEVDISNNCYFIRNDQPHLWVECINKNYKNSHSNFIEYKNIMFDSNKQKREFYDIFIENKFI